MYVLIPTMNLEKAKILVDSLLNQTIVPEKIFVVDNTENQDESYQKSFCSSCKVINYYKSNCSIVSFGKNIGVNAAWNYGLKQAKKNNVHLAILNDDIEIENTFIEESILTFYENIHFGVICPYTKKTREEKVKKYKDYKFHLMSKKEGWAFVINRRLVKELPYIPKELFIFFGDDWIYYFSNKLGVFWVKNMNIHILHEVGFTLKKNKDLRRKLEYERVIYKRIINGGDYGSISR